MSPALSNFYQTLSTLRFASRAKAVRNQPQINEIHDSPLHQEIAHLQAQLSLRDSKFWNSARPSSTPQSRCRRT